jgi:hypothetical protein
MKKRRQQKTRQQDILVCACTRQKARKDVENIGEFSLADIKAGISAVKQKVGKTYADVQAAQAIRKKELEQEARIEKAQATKRANRRAAEKIVYDREVGEREQWDQLTPSQQATARKRGHKEPPVPRRPEVDVKAEWEDAKYATTQWAKRQVTPGGLINTARGVGDAALKGMNWVEKKRQEQLAYQKAEQRARQEAWAKLPKETRDELLKERYEREQLEHKLKQMRLSAAEYHADKSMAAITGQNFRPRVFKVASENRWGDPETKYLDEYGREVEGIPEETTKRRRSHRSEVTDIENLFGAEYSRSRAYEPSPRQRIRTQEVIMGSSPQPQIRRRTEADDFRRLLT